MQDIRSAGDEDLVRFYKEGNERAFDELYGRYEQKLKRVIYYYIPSVDEVQDIFHEVLVRVIRHIDTFDPAKSFGAWIYQIAVNCTKNHLKRSNRENRIVEREMFRLSSGEAVEAPPEESLISSQDMAAFGEVVAALEEKFREVFLLRYDQQMKYNDIAELLNCSERTAKWRMEKAIEKISYGLKQRGVI